MMKTPDVLAVLLGVPWLFVVIWGLVEIYIR